MVFLGDALTNKYGVEWCEPIFSQHANPRERRQRPAVHLRRAGIFRCRVVGNKNSQVRT